ncbi:Predicted enzyme related to lactoylglutathione lyase [Chlamydia abortus]|uniref:VOC family protein n=1 Tax=Paenibacillus residui TaxID=629724 RepID=A0ABW3DAK4_9BACL|nr:VOC family protein [Paenibacillus sp. 32O-W]SHE13517.1 Predicted enzyme related to lactoylglutathione lyase [Chlamydia abortus]
MTPKTKAIPEGHHAVTPYMIIKDAAEAITFYKKAFGATELMRITDANGKVRHAEIKIGDSPIMIVDEFPEYPIMQSPKSLGGATMHIFLYVDDVDALFAQAIDAGAKELEPVENHVEGDRRGGVMDPFGHIWWIATHIKDVPLEEL